MFTTLTVAACQMFANSDGSGYLVIGLVILGWFVACGVSRASEGSRTQLATTDRKRCPHCRTAHPGFASYCRECGGKF